MTSMTAIPVNAKCVCRRMRILEAITAHLSRFGELLCDGMRRKATNKNSDNKAAPIAAPPDIAGRAHLADAKKLCVAARGQFDCH